MFKKGDKVRCIDTTRYAYITEDRVYEVIKCTSRIVYIRNDIYGIFGYCKDHFELVDESNYDSNINAVLGEAIIRGESTLTVNGVTFKVIKV